MARVAAPPAGAPASAGLAIAPISTALGAVVTGLDLREAGEESITAIKTALATHAVLVFRDQALSPGEQLAFARNFGKPVEYPFAKGAAKHPAVTQIVKHPDEVHNFGSGWHMDMSFSRSIPSATILHALEVPEVGGDTMFANLRLAYRTLSPQMQAVLRGLVILHRAWPGDSTHFRGMNAVFATGELETAERDLVSRHAGSGEEYLALSPFYARELKGMSDEESGALISFLNDHATRPEHTCRLSWQKGDLVIWDNRCTIHNALDDDFGARLTGKGFSRRMQRVVVC